MNRTIAAGLALPMIIAMATSSVLAAVAAALDITPLQFATCFAGVTPARTGAELNGQKERDNKAILLPCLQAINPDIDNARLDSVMDRFRGAPPPN
ncbi:MAG: hypothetical protein KKF33_03430 [Alphaproteobacteria bacterium]|nr:hypothetical protein [Alphaproteobacteria bacterium]